MVQVRCTPCAERVGQFVTIVADAADPDGDLVSYRWTVTAGELDAKGREARWTSGAIGRAEVTVSVNDGMGGTSARSISVEMLAPDYPLMLAPPEDSTLRTDVMSGALSAYQLGRFEEALQAFMLAQRLWPREPDTYFYVGEIYLRQGNASDAIWELERHLTLAGRSARPEAARLLALARAMRAQAPDPKTVAPPPPRAEPPPRPPPPHAAVGATESGSQRPPVTMPPDYKGLATGAEPLEVAPAPSGRGAAATHPTAPSLTSTQPFQWVLLAMGGALFLIGVTAAVFIPAPTLFQQSVLRTTLALGASMIAASIPWFVGGVGGSGQMAGLAVGGALGVFILVFFVDPVTRLHAGPVTALPLVSSAVKAEVGCVFISYRRAERLDLVDRLHERLESRLGPGTVFKDVSDIKPGQKFRDVLADALNHCRVALIIIGPEWERMRNANGVRRIDDPDDFVAMEVASVLLRSIPIVPILVARDEVPLRESLPEKIVTLRDYQAMPLRPDPDFANDLERLVGAISHLTGDRPSGAT